MVQADQNAELRSRQVGVDIDREVSVECDWEGALLFPFSFVLIVAKVVCAASAAFNFLFLLSSRRPQALHNL